MHITKATAEDLPMILELQYLAYQSEAKLCNDVNIPPLRQSLPELREEHEGGIVLKAVDGAGTIVGSVRARASEGSVFIGKLIVHPDCQGRGIGTKLLGAVEAIYPNRRFELFTSTKSERNIALYKRQGYRVFQERKVAAELTFVYLEKRV